MNTPPITPDMTVLDVVSTYRETEDVFRRYDNQAGECICCNALFDTLRDVAVKYKINPHNLLVELCAAAQDEE